MSWKTTDSAKRSGISDYNRGTIKQNTERFSADYAVISDLSLQYLYGFRNDSVNNNALEIRADSLAFNKPKSSGVRALRIAIDDSNNALIGRKVSGKEAGLPDYSDSLCFKKNGNIVLFGDTEYTVPNTGSSVQTGFTIHNSIGIDKELYVSKDTHFYSNVNIDNSLNIGRNAHIKGDVIVDGSLTVFGLIKPNFTEVSGNFLVDKDLVVRGNTSLQDFTAHDGSMNDLSVNYFHLVNNGYVNPGATLRIDGSMVIAGEIIFTGSATEIGTVSISGDASYNGFLYGSKNLYLGSKHQQDDQPGQVNKFIQATKSSMSTGDSYSMCFGKDTSTGNQGQLSYYHNSNNSSVTLGVSGKNNIAINSNGNVSIGRDISNVTTPSSLDVSGSVTVAAQSDYIYTTPSLHIDNTSRDDSTGASIKLTGRRNLWSENQSNNKYPYLTGADIIFENFNDANPTSSNAAKIATKKIHGVIKTFQTDNSWNIGDMAFYGQDNSSLYTATDTSGITEFMRFDASSQFVRFSKDVGIGGVKGEVVNMTPVITTHALPQYPDPSAVLDLRTYTYYGQTGRSEQPGWKGGNILLAPENNTGNNNDKPNGLIWKPLAGEINTTTATFDYNYTKESAGIKFMPAANFYRGGLAFFTNNTADVSTNAVERMRIDEAGNVGIGTSTPSSTLDVSGSTNITGTANIGGQLSVHNISANQSNKTSTFSGKVKINDNTDYNVTNNNSDTALFVKGGVKIDGNLGVEKDITTKTGQINLKTPQTRLRVDNGNMLFVTSAGERMRVTSGGNVKITGNVGINIGGQNPSSPLDVSGNTNITGNLYLGDTSKGLINGYQNRILSLHSSNKPRLSVMNNGHVSIGNNSSGDSLDAPALLTIGHPLTPNTNHNDTSFGVGTKILLGNEGSATENKYVIGFGAFNANVLTGTHYPPAYIGYVQKVYTGNTGYGDLIFGTKNNPSSAIEATEHMRIQNSGYVGIGTTTPSEMLDVNGSTNIKLNLSVGGNTTLNGTNNLTGSNTLSNLIVTGAATLQKNLTIEGDTVMEGNLTIDGNIDATGQQISCEFINTTGKVGIGQNYDPANLFTVAHGSSIYNPSLSVDQGCVAINAQANSTNPASPGLQGYHLYVNGTTNLGNTVNIEGNVTMGDSNTTHTFTLNGKDLSQIISDSHGSEGYALLNGSRPFTGSVAFRDGIAIKNFGILMDNHPIWLSSGSSGSPGQVYLGYTPQTSGSGGTVYLESDSHIQLQPNNNGHVSIGPPNNTYKLYVNGDIGATSFSATSDENKKEDIETISDATEKLTSLRGVSYKLKEDEEKKTHYGVVAQELEKVFPDMVRGEEGDKSVAYMEIIGVLIETVKDLNKRIKKLEESSK